MVTISEGHQERLSFESKIDKALWIGFHKPNRNILIELSKTNPDLIVAQVINNSLAVPLEDYCKYKFLIDPMDDLDSYVKSKYLMSCGSVVIQQKTPYPLFWTHLLQDNINMIQVQPNWPDLIQKIQGPNQN